MGKINKREQHFFLAILTIILSDRNSRLSSITRQFHQLPTQFHLKICLMISSQDSVNSILLELGWQRNHEWFSLVYRRWLILSFGLAEPIQFIFLSCTGFSFEIKALLAANIDKVFIDAKYKNKCT